MSKVLFITFLLFSQNYFSYALDWKSLHNRADSSTLEQALENVKSSPRSLDDLYLLGLVYLNLHRDNQAKDVFDKILEISSNTIEAKWGIAEVLRRKHQLDESQKRLNEILKANPDFSPACISLAYIKYLRLDFNGCISMAKQVIRQGKNNVDLSNYTRAYLLVAGAKGTLAHYGGFVSKLINGAPVFATLKKAERLQPKSAVVLLSLGGFYFLAPPMAGGNLNKAEDYLLRAAKADPLFADTYVRLAQLYRLKGDNAKYTAYLNKALEIDPQNELALDTQNGSCRYACK